MEASLKASIQWGFIWSSNKIKYKGDWKMMTINENVKIINNVEVSEKYNNKFNLVLDCYTKDSIYDDEPFYFIYYFNVFIYCHHFHFSLIIYFIWGSYKSSLDGGF